MSFVNINRLLFDLYTNPLDSQICLGTQCILHKVKSKLTQKVRFRQITHPFLLYSKS